eukprot:11619800-Prorocentrum_lima.AAC.1
MGAGWMGPERFPADQWHHACTSVLAQRPPSTMGSEKWRCLLTITTCLGRSLHGAPPIGLRRRNGELLLQLAAMGG